MRQARASQRDVGLALAAVLLTAAALLACAGCEGPGFVTYVIAGPPKVDAKYILAQRQTLVVVDDPEQLLGDPNYTSVIGANVRFNLIQNGALPEALVVAQDRLTTLAAGLGDGYKSLPLDQIGARLGAEQVIYVLVKSVSMRADNTYYHPTATAEVKVIDVLTGGRLFPENSADPSSGATPPGHRVVVELRKQTLDESRRHALQMLGRSLAERIGLETAQVFYQHIPEETKPK